MLFILFFPYLFTPTICYPEVMTWGIQNSIGGNPYGLNFFEKTHPHICIISTYLYHIKSSKDEMTKKPTKLTDHRLTDSTIMYMGWYGHQDNDYPLSIYKDGLDGNSRFIHDFKRYSELIFLNPCF